MRARHLPLYGETFGLQPASSAGGHLAPLLSASPTPAKAQGAMPWLGTISLDSGPLDVARTMQARDLPLFDQAFRADRAHWLAASPYQQMRAHIVPLLECARAGG